jgi:hypothetical protein
MAEKSKNRGRDADRTKDVEARPYRVGYGRPPAETRFKPGVSGNPKGRSKKTPSFSDVTEQVLNEHVEMRVGDRVLRMSNRQALVAR